MSDQHTVAEDIPIPLILVDRESYAITWMNMSAQERLGKSSKSLSGKHIEMLFSEPAAIIDACDRVKASMARVTLHNFRLDDLSGQEYLSDLCVYPTDGRIGVCLLPPAEPGERAEEADLSILGMGRLLAHEIKNPLAGINGAAQLILDEVATEEGRGLINLIQSEIERIRRLADRMERLGDDNPESFEPVNIHEILRQARRVMEGSMTRKIHIREDFDPSLPEALADSDTLMQAIINLVKNAIESIENSEIGDEIRLQTAFHTGITQKSAHGSHKQHLPIRISVIDNGPGIPDDVKDQVFQPFVSQKPTGQGLGLSLVSKVARAHGGHVRLKVKPGQTKFEIMLPAAHPTETDHEI